jgi:hypothetical protein
MWSIFKKKKLKEEQLLMIKKEYNIIKEKAEKLSNEIYQLNQNKIDKNNSVCPSCSSKYINDRIKRIQGSIEGGMSGGGSFICSSVSGYISGKIDTNEINKCNDCGHEWKKRKNNYQGVDKYIENKIDYVDYYLMGYSELKHCKFNLHDLDEKYNSLEEKKAALLNDFENHWTIPTIKEFWGDISIEAFIEISSKYLNMWEEESKITKKRILKHKDILLKLGFTNLKDKLSK